MAITMNKKEADTIPTPATGKVTFFIDDDTGLPSYKDENGDTIDLTGDTGPAGTANLIESITGMIESPTNKSYILDQYAPFAYTINSLVVKLVSGTCTAKIQIDGVDVTGISSVSCTSGETTATASAANTVAIGNTITLVISSISTPVDS
jgi:hypothetical protein